MTDKLEPFKRATKAVLLGLLISMGIAVAVNYGLFFQTPVGLIAWTAVGALVLAPAVFLQLPHRED